MASSTAVQPPTHQSGQPGLEIPELIQGKLDLTRFQELLQQHQTQTAKRLQVPSHQLVRFVRNGKVQWTTAVQAKELIAFYRDKYISDHSGEIAEAIEHALHGDVSTIENELLMLLCISYSGCEEDEEALKGFQRRQKEILEGISEIHSMEIELEHQKRESGVIKEFEDKVGLMMEARHTGNEERARQLAQEVRSSKKKYVLYTHSISPVIAGIHAQRTDLIRIKEKLLKALIQMTEEKEKNQVLNMKEMAKSSEKLIAYFDASQQNEKQIDAGVRRQLKDKLQQLKHMLQTSNDQKEVFECEKELLEEEQQRTQAVIQGMERSIGEDQTQSQVQKAKTQIKSPAKKEPAVNKLSRMTRVKP